MERRYNQPPPHRNVRYAEDYRDEGYPDDYFSEEDEYVDRGIRQPQGQPSEGEGKGKEKESMASWLGRVTTSSQVQFAATAIVSGAIVAGGILGYQSLLRAERVSELKSGIPEVRVWDWEV
jgi:hypothetical protein